MLAKYLTFLLWLDDLEHSFSGLTLGRDNGWICRWYWIVLFMDLELYIEKTLSSTAGRGPSRGGALVTAPRIGQSAGCRVNPGSIDGSDGPV